uniref:Uncharacterized protein n=1 Tax=Panagrolaimus davidi TaxID=227884 RepID=A0A914QK10_9BILA
MPAQASSTSSSKSNLHKRIVWPKKPSIKQAFSLPDSFIHYIAKNPLTPNIYNKLIRTCKYFFETNPIIVIDRMHDGTKICANDPKTCEKNDEKCCRDIDMKQMKCKLWITNFLTLCGINMSAFVPLFHQKVICCENTHLSILRTSLVFDDLKILASKFKSVCIYEVLITYHNGTMVMLDKIIGAIPSLEKFEYWFKDENVVATSLTLKKIIKLKNLGSLQRFELNNIPEIFDTKDLLLFFKAYKNTEIDLDFFGNLSQEYKGQLDSLIDILIKLKVPNHIIEYDGQDQEKLEVLENL